MASEGGESVHMRDAYSRMWRRLVSVLVIVLRIGFVYEVSVVRRLRV